MIATIPDELRGPQWISLHRAEPTDINEARTARQETRFGPSDVMPGVVASHPVTFDVPRGETITHYAVRDSAGTCVREGELPSDASDPQRRFSYTVQVRLMSSDDPRHQCPVWV